MQEGLQNTDALAHPFGESAYAQVAPFGVVNESEKVGDTAVNIPHARQFAQKAQIFGYRQVIIEAHIFWHVANCLANCPVLLAQCRCPKWWHCLKWAVRV